MKQGWRWKTLTGVPVGEENNIQYRKNQNYLKRYNKY